MIQNSNPTRLIGSILVHILQIENMQESNACRSSESLKNAQRYVHSIFNGSGSWGLSFLNKIETGILESPRTDFLPSSRVEPLSRN